MRYRQCFSLYNVNFLDHPHTCTLGPLRFRLRAKLSHFVPRAACVHKAANAARATLGINVAEYCITEEPAGVTLEMTSGGASWGTVKGLDSLVAAGRRLVEEAG